jgi:hypothetical protein
MKKWKKSLITGALVFSMILPALSASGATLTAVFYSNNSGVVGVEARTTGFSGRGRTHTSVKDNNRSASSSVTGTGSTSWTKSQIQRGSGTLSRSAWFVKL